MEPNKASSGLFSMLSVLLEKHFVICADVPLKMDYREMIPCDVGGVLSERTLLGLSPHGSKRAGDAHPPQRRVTQYHSLHNEDRFSPQCRALSVRHET